MADDFLLPPDAGTSYRARANRFVALYEREGVDTPAPSYANWVAQIVTGLYQAQPPSHVGLPEDPETLGRVVDYLEEGGGYQAGTGLAVFRPAFNGERWIHQVISPANVAPVWNHRTLAAAVVWTLHDIPGDGTVRKMVAIVEYWGINRERERIDTPETWVATVDIGRSTTAGAYTIDKLYPIDQVPADLVARVPAVAATVDAADSEEASKPRNLVTVAWKWRRTDPVPIYFPNEGVITATEKLHEVEQTDAVMVRNRIAVSKDLVQGSSRITDDGQRVLAEPGWVNDQALFVVNSPTGASFSEDAKGFLEPIQFDDSLTQTERIESRKALILEQSGINPQSVGMSISGRSDSAAAKRADQQMTMNTVESPGRRMSAALSAVFQQEARLNADTPEGVETVEITVHTGVKPVLVEAVETAARMDAADLGSTETIIRVAQPGRTDAYYREEQTRMAEEGRSVIADEPPPAQEGQTT